MDEEARSARPAKGRGASAADALGAPAPFEPGPSGDAPADTGARWQQAAAFYARWRDGDAKAMDELVRLMTPVLWHVVRAYGLSRAAAEDIVQTTWLTFVRKHDSITDGAAVSAWLTTTARREAWRTSRVDGRADATEDEALERRMPPQRSAEEEALDAVTAQRLWRAVLSLDERCRHLLRVVAFDDRPDYRRIADELHMPIGSIGPTRQRCLGKLRALLDGGGAERGDDHGRG
ncbi:RNA polymerase sigma factor [Microbacterium album]|uniref:RNA polymerase sigma factor n=1 Tax=Microbacterium album TaxID=2053191 RepID=A0A917IIA7_9MICO|nr:sigma-70 family RNA polymerase sigma factor [Microbacterium album]GGH48990.1 RNA polymerase sigma factor [Microbacterium album]